jgi:hypothetical protein
MYMLRVPNRLSHVLVPLTGLSDSERSGAHVLPQQLTTLHRELTAHKAHGSIAQAVEAFFLFPSILERRGEGLSCPHAQGEFSVGRVATPMWASPGTDVGEPVPVQMWASPGSGVLDRHGRHVYPVVFRGHEPQKLEDLCMDGPL